MIGGTWLVDPETGERVAAVHGDDGKVHPVNTAGKPAPKPKPAKDGGGK